MSKFKIPVHTVHSGILQENAVMLGEKSMKKLKIPAHGTIRLTFGSFRQEVTVIPVPKADSLRVSEALARKLGLRQRLSLNASYSSGSRTLRLGPLIGVLVSRDHRTVPKGIRPDHPVLPGAYQCLPCTRRLCIFLYPGRAGNTQLLH